MKQTEQILLQAIQKSLWGRDIAFSPDTDWKAVLDEAEKQTILCIAISAAPAEYQSKYQSRAGFDVAHFIRILHFQSALCELFQANGIPMVILKGTAAAIYYPNPMQRRRL